MWIVLNRTRYRLAAHRGVGFFSLLTGLFALTSLLGSDVAGAIPVGTDLHGRKFMSSIERVTHRAVVQERDAATSRRTSSGDLEWVSQGERIGDEERVPEKRSAASGRSGTHSISLPNLFHGDHPGPEGDHLRQHIENLQVFRL